MLDPKFLGGKGYGLLTMMKEGVNVPPFVILPTTVWAEYRKKPKVTLGAIKKELKHVFSYFKEFKNPYLLSIRSGAPVSCPGMMDTLLNVGMTRKNMPAFVPFLGEQCAIESQKRFLVQYGTLVQGLDKEVLEKHPVEQLHSLIGELSIIDQVMGSIQAVLESWDNPRAQHYRGLHNIPYEIGTAIVIQQMVMGNLNDQSCTGVVFTRCTTTGNNEITGEFLVKAQGEDVVDGSHTPVPLPEMKNWNLGVYNELCTVAKKLEALKQNVQDIEFTIQNGGLFILQTRTAKRSANASLRIAIDLIKEGVPLNIVLKNVTARDYDLVGFTSINPDFIEPPLKKGIAGGGGVVSGVVVLTSEQAINSKTPCILVTKETTPNDIAGMSAAVGILTMAGGMTCHAAVVARGLNKACVVGLCEDLSLFSEGDIITLDGETGNVWKCEVPSIQVGSELKKEFEDLLLVVSNIYPWAEVGEGVVLHPKVYEYADALDAYNYITELSKEKDVFVSVGTKPLTNIEEHFLALFTTTPQQLQQEFIQDFKNLLPLFEGEKVQIFSQENTFSREKTIRNLLYSQ